jgi:hypothetical protein
MVAYIFLCGNILFVTIPASISEKLKKMYHSKWEIFAWNVQYVYYSDVEREKKANIVQVMDATVVSDTILPVITHSDTGDITHSYV